MRRKSERNKSKGSPEKKVEKATRKSTRRRGKRATSSSPEREEVELKTPEATKSDDNAKESITQPATRLKIKELKSIAEEESSMKQITSSVNEPEVEKVQQEGGAGEGGSVWKVARADASPGEIQKLKLCRQRNPSEASDSSSSRKKSHKSYESGEGDGDGEEGDSAEELTRSGRNKDIERSERLDDPSSSNPRAQDFKEEVSHCSDEVLPRNTTSSSDSAKLNFLLSDDDDNKMKLDRLAENSAQNDSEPDPNIVNEPSSNGDDFKPCDNPADEREDAIAKIEEKHDEEKKEEEEKGEEEKEEGRKEEESVAPPSTEEPENKETVAMTEERKESSSDEEDYKRRKSPESSENKSQDNRDEGRRNIRRKHRSKYHESSDSDTPESEDEPREKKMEDSKPVKEEEKEEEIVVQTENESPTIPVDDRLGSNAEEEEEEEEKKDRKEQKTVSESEERPTHSIDDKNQDDEKAKSTIPKPPKVNLKRSFSSRFTEAEETPKKDDSEKKNGESEVPLHQEKDNNATADETEAKNNIIPRKRRWGTTTTTVTAEVVPAFTVSTDSLKALVPGAKPLSITEVRLSKDDDEEKSKRKEREKRYSVGDDTNNGDKKIRDENVVGAKIVDALKKEQQSKHDNHIGAKRKISILKEMPRVKSPSPSFDKATNILLIKNLVRPFTLNQIKELLSRTGTIVENGFWIDGIKSKCYVVYSNEDQAFETRQALHGISWPVSNPKRLQVEYATKEDMDLARELSKDQPVQRKAEPLVGSDNWQQVWARDDKQNVALKVTTVREWDLGKEDGGQVKEKEREKKDLDKKRRQRSRSPPVEPHLPPPARKFKKKEDEPPPAKLLDDLFKKTKAIPCIYWLPLTNEQIVVKEEMRRQHMAEHARRLEEMKRAERSRDPGSRRRRSPRK